PHPPHSPGVQVPPHAGRGDREPGGIPNRPGRDPHAGGAPARPDRSRDRSRSRDRDGDGIPNRLNPRPDFSNRR
ncbi:MAG: hypothetical protein WA147_00030, partial [Polaromonas sp.]